jgi:hypothetical protein
LTSSVSRDATASELASIRAVPARPMRTAAVAGIACRVLAERSCARRPAVRRADRARWMRTAAAAFIVTRPLGRPAGRAAALRLRRRATTRARPPRRVAASTASPACRTATAATGSTAMPEPGGPATEPKAVSVRPRFSSPRTRGCLGHRGLRPACLLHRSRSTSEFFRRAMEK